MIDAIEILLVEDDPQDLQLTLRALQGETLGIVLKYRGTAKKPRISYSPSEQ